MPVNDLLCTGHRMAPRGKRITQLRTSVGPRLRSPVLSPGCHVGRMEVLIFTRMWIKTSLVERSVSMNLCIFKEVFNLS